MSSAVVAAESDISADGNYGSRWLVSDAGTISVVRAQDGSYSTDESLQLASVRELVLRKFWGCWSLEARTDEGRREVVRFTSSRLARFQEAKTVLDSLIEGDGAPKAGEAAETPPRQTEAQEASPGQRLRLGSRAKTVWRLMSYLNPYRKYAVFMIALMLIGTVVQLVPAYFIKVLVDDVLRAGHRQTGLLVAIIAVLVGSQAVSALVSIGRSRLSGWLGGKISARLRSELFERVQLLSVSFFDKKTTGAVTANITQDTRMLHLFSVDVAETFTINSLLLVGVAAILFYLDPVLALVVFVPLPVAVILAKTLFGRLTTMFRSVWQAWMYLYRAIDRSISGIRLVKAFGQEHREIARFRARNSGLFDREWDVQRSMSLYQPAIAFVMALGMFAIWLIGGLRVMDGDISLGSLLAFIAYATMLHNALQSLSRMGQRLSQAMTSAERVFEVLDAVPEVKDAEDALPMETIRGAISFRNVCFGYDKDRRVLHDICLEAKPGEMIGLVGHSGAGKTTMINLLCRFYDTDEGAVLIDGVDVRRIKLEDLRRNIGLVPQDTFLFEGSVAENISYANPNAPLERVLEVAAASNAHDFIMSLEDAYDSEVGERGHRLSRGQRQMISIARVLLEDPPLLVLDEPTSSVDFQTEEHIQRALLKAASQRTTFAIAHRLSTIKSCNRLVVLHEGRIVESGTHEELISKEDGVFRSMVDTHVGIPR